jgi:uncharacterized cupin superfamily protein
MSTAAAPRPPFIVNAADVEPVVHRSGAGEAFAPARPIGRQAGLRRIGLHVVALQPGTRTSLPHAERDEEEFVYVAAGDACAWIDGHLFELHAGDLVALPAGTGIAHTILGGSGAATLIVGGERDKRHNQTLYPSALDAPARAAQVWSKRWDDAPARARGPHDGLPTTPGAVTHPRPPFIVAATDLPEQRFSYPGSDELMNPGRAIGALAGLVRIGLHLERVTAGTRTSWPHAESDEEEFVYVLAGEVDAWIDGHLHRMRAGDLAAFPAGTGIAHAFLSCGPADALLLAGGEATGPVNRITYPLHPSRRPQMPWSHWWDDAPARVLGPHDGTPWRP